MIRFITLVDLKPGYERSMMPEVWAGLRQVDTPGKISFAANYDLGRDFGVNEKDWTYAVVGDFTDFDAFRTWHDDPRRRPLAMRVVPHIDRVARCVIEIP